MAKPDVGSPVHRPPPRRERSSSWRNVWHPQRVGLYLDLRYQMPAVREGFAKEGSDVVIDASPAAFGRFVDEEIATWAKVVQQSGATIK
jgi:hypothetical protein